MIPSSGISESSFRHQLEADIEPFRGVLRARLLVRCFDREHAVQLVAKDVDYLIRETFESAMTFGAMALRTLGVPEEEVQELSAEVRRRDAERFALDVAEGLAAGSKLLVGNMPKPAPFTTPQRSGVPLNEETALITSEGRG